MPKVTTTLTDASEVRIFGNADDEVFALGGQDTIYGGGNDTLFGDGGIETVTYPLSSFGVVLDLGVHEAKRNVEDPSVDSDKIYDIENVIGSDHRDFLHGDARANTIKAGGGNDRIWDSMGADQLYGGDGNDSIFITTGDSASGEVIDGGAGYDVLELSGEIDGGSIHLKSKEQVLINTLNQSVSSLSLRADQFGNGGPASDTHFEISSDAAAEVLVSMGDKPTRNLAQITSGEWTNGEFHFTRDASSEIVIGTSLTNIFDLGDGSDHAEGGKANDWIYGDQGDDTLNGGSGGRHDVADYPRSRPG